MTQAVLVVAVLLALVSLAAQRPGVARTGPRWSRGDRARADGALPDLLRRLAGELGAGRTLGAALASSARQLPRPLGPAAGRAAQAIVGGTAPDAALAATLPDDAPYDVVASALGVHHRAGGDLPRLLRGIAVALDERARVEADVRAVTAQARLSAWLVPLLPALGLLALLALDPEGLRLLVSTPAGWLVLAASAALDLVGAVAVRSIVRGIR